MIDVARYTVYFGEHDGSKAKHEIEDFHLSHLASVKEVEIEEARSSLLYSYKNSINAFAAVLTPIEASKFSATRKKWRFFLKILFLI